MNEARRPLSKEKITTALNIPDRDKKAFYQILKNRVHTDGRIARDSEQNYSACE